jgi:hypothetical protein
MATPYITPDILINAPTGISWETIPDFNSNPDAQLAEQTNICWRATHWIDTYCNQPLRATIDTEEFIGPYYRMTIDNQGLCRILTSRWPVTQIVSAKSTSSLVAPAQWRDIPIEALYIENELTISGGVSIEAAAGPSAINITPGYVSWMRGRRGTRVQLTYVNGWSHAGIIDNATVGDTMLTVDDCTGMSSGSDGRGMWIYDGSQTEYVSIVSSTATSGPGQITLSSPLLFSHAGSLIKPIVISALPATVQEAAILHAVTQALTRGATATTVQNMPGSMSMYGGAPKTTMDDIKEMLKAFRRVI